MPAKPKPQKQAKKKKSKKVICIHCGFIASGTPEHFPHCLDQSYTVGFLKSKTKTQMYKSALDRLCQMITTWRDGCKCVLEDTDGGHCGDVSQWGHVIPQNNGAFLVYELSNSFRQCNNHNLIHDKKNPDLYLSWYARKWGQRAKDMLNQAWSDNIGIQWNETDYFDKLVELSELYDMRFSFGSASLEDKVQAGFYGSIIREAWIKDGRI